MGVRGNGVPPAAVPAAGFSAAETLPPSRHQSGEAFEEVVAVLGAG